MQFSFRNDQPDEFLTILREVGQWLVDTNQTLWTIDTLTADNLINEYTEGNCYVMYVDDTPAATLILQWKDPHFWPDVPDNTSGFVHKLAIRRAFAGQNLFAAIIDFCRDECLSRGIHQLQLETDATRPKLTQFYERHGFTPTYQRNIIEFGQTFRCQYYIMTFQNFF